MDIRPFNHQILETRRSSKRKDPVLREALSVFIGSSNSQEQKKLILFRDNHYEKLLEHVSPEFEILKNLMYA